MDTGATIDGSWNSRGWTAAISVKLGKVVDVVSKVVHETSAQKWEKKGNIGKFCGASSWNGI